MIVFLYSTVVFVAAFGYIPQAITLIRNRTRCDDISIKSWVLWEYANIISLLYSVIELQDLRLSIVNGVNVFFITLILIITIYKRVKYSSSISLLVDQDEIPDEHDLAMEHNITAD